MLDLKEKELRAKEAELKKVQEDLRRTGALRPEKNWPMCYPITHHDIAGEVPHRPALSVGVLWLIQHQCKPGDNKAIRLLNMRVSA